MSAEGPGRAEIDELLERLRDRARERAPELLGDLEDVQTLVEVERTRAGRAETEAATIAAASEAERLASVELFEASPGAQIVTNRAGKILAANEQAVALLGGRRLTGRLLVSLLAAPDRPAFRRSLARVAGEAGPLHLAFVTGRGGPSESALLATARGVGTRLHWLLVDRSELRDAERELPEEDDLLARLARTNLDRLRAAYDELEAERARFQRVLARFPEGLIAVDRDLGILFSNAAARRIFYPHPLGRGTPLLEVWGGFPLREYAAGLFDRHRALIERQVELADGRVIEVHGIPERAGGDAFLLLSDVTDEARRMRVEREFVRNAAHELRTPLTAISTAIEVLQGGAKEDPADRDRFLAHIERQCARLSRLTQSMLVLARAQSDQQAPRLEFVPLRPLLEDIAASLRPAEQVTIEVACDDELAVFVDRDLAEHAVLNLAGNAIRHTHYGTVRLAARALDDRSVEIAVTDEGEGILPEHRDRLLEPFYRAGARDGNGFGLGLAISSQAIMALGGTLAIDSEPGVGTRAVISLPSARLVRTS